jgi:hypothetical protein
VTIDLAAVEARYSRALDAKPGKGPYREKGITALTDSVCDVPDLLAEIDRLNQALRGIETEKVAAAFRSLGAELERQRQAEPSLCPVGGCTTPVPHIHPKGYNQW